MLRVLSVITAALFLLHFTYIHVPRLVFLFSSTSCTKFVQQEYIKKVFTSKQDNESIKQNDDDDNGHGASSISRSPVFSLVHYFLNFILSLCLFLLCRYFVLDPELGQLQYFVNEQGKSQKPRGSLPLIGASVTTSDEAPHMFIVNAVNGELYKLRGMSSRWPQAARIRQRTNSERVCVCVLLWIPVKCGVDTSSGGMNSGL